MKMIFAFTAFFLWTFSHEFHMLWFCLCIGSARFVKPWFIFQAMLVLCLSHTDSSNSLPELRENLHRLYTTDRFLDTRRSSDLITNMYLRFVFWGYKIIGHQGDVWGGGFYCTKYGFIVQLGSQHFCFDVFTKNITCPIQTCILISIIWEGV